MYAGTLGPNVLNKNKILLSKVQLFWPPVLKLSS